MVSVVAVAVGGANMTKLQQAFERHLIRSRFFTYHDKVVVAVSTGVDSMVLLDLLQRLPTSYRPQIIVAHMNHELRAQSQLEEQFIQQYCKQHDLPLEIAHWPKAQHPQNGVENAARQARYRFFKQVLEKYSAEYLVTAHHQNDLAETMLMKLTRGGQIDQLVGIRDQRPFGKSKLVRPLLPFSKKSIRDYAQGHHLKWYEDETNNDLDIQRNRYRHEIIPLLEKENPQVLSHLTHYHQQLSELLAWRDQEVGQRLQVIVSAEGKLNVAGLLESNRFLQKGLLRQWLSNQHVHDVKEQQLSELLQILANSNKPQQTVLLPHQYKLERNYSVCVIKKVNNQINALQNPREHVIELGQWYQVDKTSMIAVSTEKAFFADEKKLSLQWLALDQFPLRIRKWQKGDHIRLKGGQHQLVKRVLINQKVPQDQRDQQQVLIDAHGEVIWLINRKWSWFERPTDYQQAWRLCFIGIKDKE